MNPLTAKLVSGLTRLAFWRRPAAPTPEEPESLAALEPAAVPQSILIGLESSEDADTAVLQTGWFARLKQVLRRRPNPAQEAPADADEIVATESPSPRREDASATADEVVVPQSSWLARLKGKLRRHPKPEPLEAEDEDTPRSSVRQASTATRPGEIESAADEEAVPVSGIQRLRAILSNKWVWASGISVMLIAIIATMMAMLLQSGQEKKQLQIELVAAQKKLKQASAVKQVVVNPVAPKQAGSPSVATAGNPSAGSRSGIDAGGCDVSSKENVTHNLKNCIDSFNAMAN